MAPPLPAVALAGALGWNYVRSRRRTKPTISRWACEHKRLAVVGAAAFSAWWLCHWALYVIELPDV